MWYRFSHPLRTLAIAARLVRAVACGSNDSGSDVLVETSTGPSNARFIWSMRWMIRGITASMSQDLAPALGSRMPCRPTPASRPTTVIRHLHFDYRMANSTWRNTTCASSQRIWRPAQVCSYESAQSPHCRDLITPKLAQSESTAMARPTTA